MRVIYDVENAPNFFLLVALRYDPNRTGEPEFFVYEISERQNDIERIFRDFKGKFDVLIGFNSKHYDDLFVNYIIKNYGELRNLNPLQITGQLQELSNAIISDFREIYKPYKYGKNFKQLDLFLYWTQLIRRSKKISLKACQGALNWHNVQDLPFEPGTELLEEDFNMVIDYCKNDVLSTEAVAKALRKQIRLKANVSRKYNKDYFSSDSVNMGLDIFLNKYCNETHSNPKEVKELRTFHREHRLKDYILPYVKFETPEFQSVLENYHNNQESFSQYFQGVVYKYGQGGIHSKDKPCVQTPGKGYKLWEIDATSYYPHLLFQNNWFPAHLSPKFVEVYKETYYERLAAKKEDKRLSKIASTRKLTAQEEIDLIRYSTINDVNKLILNGLTGNLKNEYSWVCDASVNLKITINGQLLLSMLIEKLAEKGIPTLSANTDGICVRFKDEDEPIVREIIEWWEEMTSIPLETTNFHLIVKTSVNDYFAIDDKEIKQKGDFITHPNFDLFHSNNNLVIPKALRSHFIHKHWRELRDLPFLQNEVRKPFDEFIKEHDNIFDFCSMPKVGRIYTVYWNGKKQQRTNRFYVSKKGAYLYKKKKTKDKLDNMLKGYGVMIYNQHQELSNFSDYDIDYDYYLGNTRKIVEDVVPKQLKLF